MNRRMITVYTENCGGLKLLSVYTKEEIIHYYNIGIHNIIEKLKRNYE